MAPPAAGRRYHRQGMKLALAIATTAVVAPAQHDLQSAVAGLLAPAMQARSCAALESAGARAVPHLRRLLARIRGEELPPGQATTALYVLGRLQRTALPALPEVRDAYAFALDVGVRNQAMWAMGQLAPLGEGGDDAAACIRLLRAQGTADLDPFLFRCVELRLLLAIDDRPEGGLSTLAAGGPGAVAVAEALVARGLTPDAVLRGRLLELLAQATGRLLRPWDRVASVRAAEGPLALVAWTCFDRRDAATARGLLAHWDPVHRRTGLIALLDGGKLPPVEQLDVVARLWDRDRSVRELALAAVRSWGGEGLVALPSLRAFARDGGEARFAAGCGRAADRLVEEACAGRSAAAASVVRDVDALLRGDELGAVGPLGHAAEAGAVLAVLATGCYGAAAAVQSAVADYARRRGLVGRAVVDAFLRNLAAGGGQGWQDGLSALSALGPDVARIHPDFEVLILRAWDWSEAEPRLALGAEAEVLAGSAATHAALLAAADSDRWHVALRALIELARRGAADEAAVARAGAAAGRWWPHSHITQGPDWGEARGTGCRSVGAGPDHDALRLAAALVLLGSGADGWDRRDVREAAGTLLGLDRAGERLRAAAAQGQAGELAARLLTAVRGRHRWFLGADAIR